MHSEHLKKITVVFLIIAFQFLSLTVSHAELVERIVAIVNDDLILLSEFRKTLQSAKDADVTISEDRVLNDMIDNMLLLNEAMKYRVIVFDRTGKTEKESSLIVGEYIDRRIKALIHIPYEDIEKYYQTNRELFGDKKIIDVRDAIEEQLLEAALRIKLREHIEELRKKAYVRIQLHE